MPIGSKAAQIHAGIPAATRRGITVDKPLTVPARRIDLRPHWNDRIVLANPDTRNLSCPD